jgi:hypothetical protein
MVRLFGAGYGSLKVRQTQRSSLIVCADHSNIGYEKQFQTSTNEASTKHEEEKVRQRNHKVITKFNKGITKYKERRNKEERRHRILYY